MQSEAPREARAMKQLVNKNLITLKCVLFAFFAGVGCLFPFLPLHMLAVGLNRGEARIISIVAPCIAMLGPAVAGPLADKLSVGRGSSGNTNGGGSGRILRLLTALCLVLGAFFYLLLLTVPYVERHEARRPHVNFKCDESGAVVLQEMCTEEMTCNRWQGDKHGSLALTGCEYSCAYDELGSADYVTEAPYDPSTQLAYETATFVPQGDSGEVLDESEDGDGDEVGRSRRQDEDDASQPSPPHLCEGGQAGLCHVDTGRRPVTVAVTLRSGADNATAAWCAYPSGGAFHCPIPAAQAAELVAGNESCRPVVRCRVLAPYDVPGGVLADAQCRRVLGDPDVTFWTYLIIRCVADIFPTAALALLGAACVVATRETSRGRGDVGRQLAVGTLGLAVLPPLAGLAASAVPTVPYLVPILLYALCMLIAAAILVLDGSMPVSTPEWWWHTATGVLAMPMNTVRRYGAEIAALFAVMTLLGTLWSAMDSYIPWTIMDLSGNETETTVGLSLLVGALPAVPVLWWAEAIVDFCGHSNLLITAFTFYCLRYTGLAFSEEQRWVLASEALEVFTLSLVWVTAVLYFRHLVPRKYTCTGQALPVLAHFCLGRCIGAVLGSLVSLELPLESARNVYRALAVAALLIAAVYLALYHLLLAPRCASPAVPPPQTLLQGLNSNGGTNGTYSPMRVYHEERSRKGHFRY